MRCLGSCPWTKLKERGVGSQTLPVAVHLGKTHINHWAINLKQGMIPDVALFGSHGCTPTQIKNIAPIQESNQITCSHCKFPSSARTQSQKLTIIFAPFSQSPAVSAVPASTQQHGSKGLRNIFEPQSWKHVKKYTSGSEKHQGITE